MRDLTDRYREAVVHLRFDFGLCHRAHPHVGLGGLPRRPRGQLRTW
jgi:hypothetical protein